MPDSSSSILRCSSDNGRSGVGEGPPSPGPLTADLLDCTCSSEDSDKHHPSRSCGACRSCTRGSHHWREAPTYGSGPTSTNCSALRPKESRRPAAFLWSPETSRIRPALAQTKTGTTNTTVAPVAFALFPGFPCFLVFLVPLFPYFLDAAGATASIGVYRALLGLPTLCPVGSA